jgi:hypothetical protein
MPNLRVRRLLLLIASASCGGESLSTGITSMPMTVTFEPATATRSGTRLANGTLRCDADMTILAHGNSDHRVSLEAIASTFQDSIGGVANTINSSPTDWFSVGTLKRDSAAIAHRQPTGPGPFTVVSSINYRDQFGTPKVATFTLKCTT